MANRNYFDNRQTLFPSRAAAPDGLVRQGSAHRRHQVEINQPTHHCGVKRDSLCHADALLHKSCKGFTL